MTDKAFLDLLDLQVVDSEIDRLLKHRASLPELDRYKSAHAERSSLEATLAEQEAALEETTLAVKRTEGELDLLEKKKETEERRMYAGGLSSRDLENLQREIEMFGRQIATFEDEILAALDVRDEQEAAVLATRSSLDVVGSEVQRLETSIAAQWKDIDAGVEEQQDRRADIAPLIPEDLLELYERIRPSKEGVGAARLAEGVCGGCHLSLSPAEQLQVLKDDPPRCLHCRRILVPQ